MDASTPAGTAGNNEPVAEHVIQENQLNSPFLKLPAEIRNCIYEFAFAQGNIVFMRQSDSSSNASPHSRKHQGASTLIHTSRQIRHEALPIFYARTTFEVGAPELWSEALKKHGSDLYKLFRCIKMTGETAFEIGLCHFEFDLRTYAFSSAVKAFSSLERVEIVLEEESGMSSCASRFHSDFIKHSVKWMKHHRKMEVLITHSTKNT